MAELQGIVRSADLPALFGLLARQQKSGCLRLLDGRLRGDVYFEAGAIAAAFAGTEQGLSALDALLVGVDQAQFTFGACQWLPEPNVALAGEALRSHLDAMVVQAVKVHAVVPSLEAIPRVVAGAALPETVVHVGTATLRALRAVDGRRTVLDLGIGRGLARTLQDLAVLADLSLIAFQPAGLAQTSVAKRKAAAAGTRVADAPHPPPSPPTHLPLPPAALSTGRAASSATSLTGPSMVLGRRRGRHQALPARAVIPLAVVIVVGITAPLAALALVRVGDRPVLTRGGEPRLQISPGAEAGGTPAGPPGGAALPTISAPVPAPLPPAVVAQGVEASRVPVGSGPALAPAPTESATAAGEPVASRVVQAEASLHSGQFESAITYDDGSQSSASLLFDLGDAGSPPRMRIISTYRSQTGSQVTEQVVIGEQAWEQRSGARWTTQPANEGVWHQVQSLLPHTERVRAPEVTSAGEGLLLRWYEPGYDDDVVLQVDPTTGTPLHLQRTIRATGGVIQITYRGWNTPVEITPPALA